MAREGEGALLETGGKKERVRQAPSFAGGIEPPPTLASSSLNDLEVWHGVTAGLKDDGAPPFFLAGDGIAPSHDLGAPEKIVTPIAASRSRLRRAP
jgi:hypothetical protein